MYGAAGSPPPPPLPGPALAGVDPQEQVLAREERWEELVALLVDRLGRTPEAWQRVRHLLRVALVYETKLGDLERAFITLQAAFAEDFANEEASRELERLAGALGRWGQMVAEYDQSAAEVADPRQRAALLLRLAEWYDGPLGDAVTAEARLVAALGVDPGCVPAARALADRLGRRGDWARAAHTLLQAAGASADRDEAVRLLTDAAALFEQRLGDPAGAAHAYAQILERDPHHVGASRAMAEVAWQTGDWARARALFERLISADARSTDEAAALHGRLARITMNLQDLDAARAHFARAADLGGGPELLGAWLSVAESQGAWQDVRRAGEALLDRRDRPLDNEEALALTAKVGRALLELGDPRAALARVEPALAVAPEHRPCREIALEGASRLGDQAAAVRHQRALLDTSRDGDERFDRLVALARRQRDAGGDPDETAGTFGQALDLRPDDRALLGEALDFFTAAKLWKKAVPILLRLADLEDGPARGPYLVAAANILNYELRSPDEAIALYERVLDDNPDDLKTFERIERILTQKRAWKDEERAYRRMLKRLGPAPGPEKRQTLIALWRGLGEIYRSRLQDREAAAAAYEVCVQLDPTDAASREILAELGEGAGGSVTGAVRQRTWLAENARTPEEMTRHLRALGRLYHQEAQQDRVYGVCAALSTLGLADARERAHYDRRAPLGLFWPQASVDEATWHEVLFDPTEDRRLSMTFAQLAGTLALVRGRDAAGLGLQDRHRLWDPDQDPAPIARLWSYATRLLASPRLALYVNPETAGEIDVANVIEQGVPVPTVVIGGDLLARRTEKETAFILGRTLALARPEHLPLWPTYIGSGAELERAILALCKLFRPDLALPAGVEPQIQQYLTLYQRALPPAAMDPLSQLLPALVENPVDLGAWRNAAERSANRAGLLACGDVAVAAHVVRQIAGAGADSAVRELVAFSVSPAYFDLRERLGLAAGEGVPVLSLAGA
jgi:tetratricopeptide (TPR) repeat protein